MLLLAVDPDQFRRPFGASGVTGAGEHRSESFHAGLDAPQHVGIVAFAALQPAYEKLALFERTARALQRRAQLFGLLGQVLGCGGFCGEFFLQTLHVAFDRLDRPARFLQVRHQHGHFLFLRLPLRPPVARAALRLRAAPAASASASARSRAASAALSCSRCGFGHFELSRPIRLAPVRLA